jgi:hypothetical protein
MRRIIDILEDCTQLNKRMTIHNSQKYQSAKGKPAAPTALLIINWQLQTHHVESNHNRDRRDIKSISIHAHTGCHPSASPCPAGAHHIHQYSLPAAARRIAILQRAGHAVVLAERSHSFHCCTVAEGCMGYAWRKGW